MSTVFFEFLQELRWHCNLTDAQVQRAVVVAQGFGRQLVPMPSKRRLLLADAGDRAYHLLAMGTDRPTVRDRLMHMGLSRSASYRVIARAAARLHRGEGPALAHAAA